ncbi:uncharacterized protein GIQ15_03835 [Arthroderma uncinatum]|uniref:uncharacterized protein n=1 Tax=Arthroderma uncinatum TaxID=74035 RepID=UPI00144AE2C5|nr:uncharacterized protein GIQ15_03835 [Arthroderma uncinatum]KAF3481076.1 hypothetical protein GIQ15_03835 [Arthroderma uncinatum]
MTKRRSFAPVEGLDTSHSSGFRKESWSLYAIGMTAVLLRTIARVRRMGVRGLQSDDYLILSSVVWYTLLCVSLNEITMTGGSNLMTAEDIRKLTPYTTAQRTKGAKWVFVAENAMTMTIWTLKACMIILYHRIMEGLSQERLVRYLTVWVAVGFVGTEMSLFLICRPLHNYWAIPPPPETQCASYQIYGIIQGVFAISADILMLAIAIPLFLTLNLPRKQKFILLFVFGLGIFVIISAVLTKLYCLVPSLISYVYMNWYFREATVGILVTSLPMTWSLLRDLFPMLREWASGTGSGISNIFTCIAPASSIISRARISTMTVYMDLPPKGLFRFPPDPRPQVLPPPSVARSWLQPFNINPGLYTALLEARVPVTVALLYAATVVLVNRLNRQRNYRPWALSKTRAFRAFVVLHNVFLAVYSVWTFLGMVHAFRTSWPRHNLVSIVDSLCKINGPRGLGNAAVYDPDTDAWRMLNPRYKLADGVPDAADVGRLWNGGLAYFGFLFYLSKFYEVLDTAIILAKGKRSSTLQTYHHAGAMMCMWAGIRYMAAPIWIFALFNSLIHAMMYTYYTLTALSVRIPVRIKKSLTTMQIMQFVVGTLLAAVHLFVYYSIPVAVPHPAPERAVERPVERADTGAGPWLKKLAFRAAGAEGVAGNVLNSNGSYFGADGSNTAHAVMDKREVRYSLEPRTFSCMNTSGQAFAVWLNLVYLLPLTFLFVRFFVRSYLRRTEPGHRHSTTIHTAEKAGMDAIKGVTREITNAVIEMHGDGEDSTGTGTGTSTPRPDTATHQVETTIPHQVEVPDIVTHRKSQVEGPTSDSDVTAYEASVEQVMSSQEMQIDSHPEESTARGKEKEKSGKKKAQKKRR